MIHSVQHVMGLYEAVLQETEGIRINKAVRLGIAIFSKDSFIADVMQAPVTNTGAFALHHVFNLIGESMLGVVKKRCLQGTSTPALILSSSTICNL